MTVADDTKGFVAGEVERATRIAVAAGLRFQSAAARTQATTLEGVANEYARLADDIEQGRVPLPTGGVRLKVVPDEEFVEEGLPGDELPAEPTVQRIRAQDFGNTGVFMPEGDESETFEPAMALFLDEFDDRFRVSEHFVTAVNEAADAGMPINARTVEVVGDRVRELTAAKKTTSEGSGDGR